MAVIPRQKLRRAKWVGLPCSRDAGAHAGDPGAGVAAAATVAGDPIEKDRSLGLKPTFYLLGYGMPEVMPDTKRNCTAVRLKLCPFEAASFRKL